MNPTPEQRDAIASRGPLVVVAAAGTGKTSVLTGRCLRLLAEGVPPHRILAVTFTEKAAREMQERLARKTGGGVALDVGTIHSFCGDVLRRHGMHLGLDADFSILDERAHAALSRRDLRAFISDLLAANDPAAVFFLENYGPGRLRRALAVLSEIGLPSMKASSLRCVTDSGEAADDFVTRFLTHCRRFAAEKLSERVARGTLSFEDLETLVLRLLTEHEAVRDDLRNRYAHVLVDEFQDVSPRQREIITALAFGARNELFLVGDPKQSIYGFRHADAENFSGLRDFVTENSGREIALTTTFRTPKKLQDFFNVTFPLVLDGRNGVTYGHIETANSQAGAGVFTASVPATKEEGAHLPERVADLVSGFLSTGVAAREIAILSGSRKYFPAITQALESRGIATAVESRADPFAGELSRFFLHAFGVLSGRGGKFSLSGLLRNVRAGFSEAFIVAVLSLPVENPFRDQATAVIDGASAVDAARWEILRKLFTQLEQIVAALGACAALDALFDFAAPRADATDLAQYLQWRAILDSWCRRGVTAAAEVDELLRELAATETKEKIPDTSEDGVRLLTVHGAKGLEFERVIVVPGGKGRGGEEAPFLWDKERGFAFKRPDVVGSVGLDVQLEDGPSYQELKTLRAQGNAAEVRRQVYVALTRAKSGLYLFPEKPAAKIVQAVDQNLDNTEPLEKFDAWLYWLSQRLGVNPLEASNAQQFGGLPPSFEPSLLEGDSSPLFGEREILVPLPNFGVTALETFCVCPKKFALSYRDNVPPSTSLLVSSERGGKSGERVGLAGLSPLERGTFLHEVMQFYAPERDNLDEVVAQALFNSHLADENGGILQACEALVAKLRRDPALEALLFGATASLNEWEFSLALPGFVLNGQIDKLVAHETSRGKRWTIVDYKSHRATNAARADALAAAFEFQLACYALAVRRQFHQPDVDAMIVFLGSGTGRKTRFSAAALGAFESELAVRFKQLTHAVVSGQFPLTEHSDACEDCSYAPGDECGRGVLLKKIT